MRVELIKRPQHSTLFAAVSPFIALALTLVFGAILFAALGKNPFTAMYVYFISPLTEVWQLHELAVKAAPLILIAVGLAVCYRSNNWNIGAEGQFIAGAIAGSIVPVMLPDFQNFLLLPLMLIMGMIGGALYGGVPALLKVRFNTNEILSSLMLVYVAQLFLDWLVRGPWRDPHGFNFPQTIQFSDAATLPMLFPAQGRATWDFVFALVAALVVWFLMARTLKGFEVKVIGQSPRAGRFAGFSSARMVFFGFLVVGRLCRARRHLRSLGGHQPAAAGDFARIRLHRDHRRLSRQAQPARHRRRRPGARAVLSRRRGGADGARRVRQDRTGLPGGAAVLRAGERHADLLSQSGWCARTSRRGRRSLEIVEAILVTIATASTPLLIAATGELVVERSGVLNLGVEGMMVMGAVSGFAAASLTGNPWVGVLAAIVVGALFSLLFGFLTLSLVTNQVATGLALTLLGIGLSGMLGEPFIGQPGVRMSNIYIPGLSDLPLVGTFLFGEDPLFYISLVLVAGVSWFLFRTRAGLTLRSVGDNHGSAHALGIPVIGIRYLAVMFGGACAGLAGSQLSLVYTPQWVENMTAGRGWIALALVVFASWRPVRVLAGAYLFGALTIAQLHIQAIDLASLGFLPAPLFWIAGFVKSVPSQFMSSLPYLATVIVLVLISRNRRLTMMNTPASLGRAFVPDR